MPAAEPERRAGATEPDRDRGAAASVPGIEHLSEQELIERIVQSQKPENSISLYWPRRASRHLTRALLKTDVTANQITWAWAALSVFNSYIVYLAMTSSPLYVALSFAVLFAVQVLDCSDGEIARCRGTASPIGGKLLDGMAHKATEYSLLVAFMAGCHQALTPSLALALGLALISGEAMYSYCYERRLLVIRLYAKTQTYISRVTSNDVYRFDERWADFPLPKKLRTLRGVVVYKSPYFMIALSLISPITVAAGAAALALHKHVAWVRLLVATIRHPPELAKPTQNT
jgi:phosphatidylglycerophosphate synthase